LLPGGSLLRYSDSQAGQLSIGFSYEHEQLDKALYGSEPIPNYNKERTINSSFTLIANYGITDLFGVTAYIPYRYIINEKVLFRGQDLHLYDGGKYFRESYGVGDIVVQAKLQRNFLDGNLPVIIGLGLKLSNGKLNATDMYGDRISDNLQVGTGTLDPVFSIYASTNVGPLLISGGAFTRLTNGENIYGYRYGNELQTLFNLDYVEYSIIYGGIQLSHLLTTRDNYEYGKVARDRGGESLFFTAKLGIRLSESIDMEMTMQSPIYQYMNESQLTSPMVLQIGSLYRIPI
jgi:hypothetical protein